MLGTLDRVLDTLDWVVDTFDRVLDTLDRVSDTLDRALDKRGEKASQAKSCEARIPEARQSQVLSQTTCFFIYFFKVSSPEIRQLVLHYYEL